MLRLHESLPSGMTRATISSATCWRRSFGRSCASRRSAGSSNRRGSAATRRTSGRTPSTTSCRAGTPPTRRPELGDFSVCTSWGSKGKDLYLLHVLRRRMEYPEPKRAVPEQSHVSAAGAVLIQDEASGIRLIQELVADGLHPVTCYQPQADKVMRSQRCRGQHLSRQAKRRFAESMHAQTAMIENGF